ncbi:3-keto-disaccharide hydrolase [Mariniflexile sp.]|uniref:3-keto-disaccharide hydrolase n=1 Tax=Mariniflexile sp. TaxID=1979402 RepID=UPI004047AB06
MIILKKLFLNALCLLLLLNCKSTENKAESSAIVKENWVKLFNGKDLNDWIIKIKGHPVGENYKNTFVVEDGVMKVNYDAYDAFDDSFGHIYYKKAFSNYKFRMQYRFTGDQIKGGAGWATRNSGVMIHCEDPKNIGLNQNFPVSIEVQLLGGLSNGEERSTGNLCTPGTHVTIDNVLITDHCITSTSPTYNGDQWVNVEIEVRNDSIIKHFINGKNVMTYNKPIIGGPVDYNEDYWKAKEGTPLKSGYISLQSESHPVEFKNIEILEL